MRNLEKAKENKDNKSCDQPEKEMYADLFEGDMRPVNE